MIKTHLPSLLEVNGLVKKFSGLVAVNHVDFHLSQGEVLGLIGPNGAGKSTVLNMVGGTLFSDEGEIIFDGANITTLADYRRARKGIARVFQRNAYFRSFTVIENVIAGLMLHQESSGMAIGMPRVRHGVVRQESKMRTKAEEILDFVGLLQQSYEFAMNLPHGKLRGLSLAIALAVNPRLLLLDEPLTGMNAQEIAVMMRLIHQLRDEMKISIIIVEHNMKAITQLCDRLVVLNYGRRIADGPPSSVIQNPDVIKAYLGEPYDVTVH